MNILKYTKIQEEINGYFNIDGTWEFEDSEPVKSLLADMRKNAAQLFDWMVAAQEGSGQENLHGAILGLKKEISGQREKVILAVQQLQDRQTEAERHAAEIQRQQEEVNIAREANQISNIANEIATRSNGIAEGAKTISESSLNWAKWALGVSILAVLVPAIIQIVDSDKLEKEVKKQIHAEYRAAIVAEVTKQVKADLSESQKAEINRLVESDTLIQERLAKIEEQVKSKTGKVKKSKKSE